MAQVVVEFRNIRAENKKISTLVWKLQNYKEDAVKQDKLCSQQQEFQKRVNILYKLICQHNEHTQDEKCHTTTREPRPRIRPKTVDIPVSLMQHESSTYLNKRIRTKSTSPKRDQQMVMSPESMFEHESNKYSNKRPRTQSTSPKRSQQMGILPELKCDFVRTQLDFEDVELQSRKYMQNEDLTKRNSSLKQELENLKKYILKLEEDKKQLCLKAEEIDKETNLMFMKNVQKDEDITNENSRLKQELEKLETYIKKLEDEKKIFCLEVERIDKEKKTMELKHQKEYTALVAEFNIYKAELNDRVAQCGDSSKIRAMRYRAERDELRYELKRLNVELQSEKLETYIKKLEDEKKKFCLEVERIDKEKKTMELKYRNEYTGLVAEFNIYKAELNDRVAQCGDSSKIRAMRYRAERDESRYELTRLNVELQKIGEKGQTVNHLARDRLVNTEYINDRVKLVDKEIQALTTERDILKRTVEDQKKLIKEIQIRTDEEMTVCKKTITQYQEEAKQYKKESEEANTKVSLTKMEKEEILLMMQKQKRITEAETNNKNKIIDNLQNMLKEMEAENCNMKNYVKNLTKTVEQTNMCNSRTNERCKYEQEKKRYHDERYLANQTVESHKSKVIELTDRLNKHQIAREQLENTVIDLKDQLAHVDKERYEQGLKEEKERSNLMHSTNEDLKQKLRETITLLHESNTRYNVENTRYRETITTMEKERTIEVTNLQCLVNQLRSELQNIRSHDEHELGRLKEHNHHLDNDRHILGKEVHSLNDQKLELQKRLQQAESQVKNQETLIEENESLKEALTTANMDRTHFEERCNAETDVRIRRDKVYTELLMENDKLQKERIAALSELERRTSEKNQLAQKLVTEINAAKAEHEQLKKDKVDLFSLFEEESHRDKEKISKLEQEYETLKARYNAEKWSHKDVTYDKLCEENSRVRSEFLKLTHAKDEKLHELKQEVTAAKLECEKLKKDKNNLMMDFKEESNKDKDKINKLRQECEELAVKYKKETEERSLTDDTNNKLIMENDKLKSDRNAAEAELIQLKNKKEDILHKLKQKAKVEHEKFNKEKEDIIRLCQNESVQLKEKCNKLERQNEELHIRYEKERETTSHNDDIYNKLKEENNWLKNERNLVRAQVMELTKEKEEMSHKLKQEFTDVKSENDKLKKEKDKLMTDFKDESKRDAEKISKLRQEYEELLVKYKAETETRSRKDIENEKLRSENKVAKDELIHIKNEKEELKQEVIAAKAEHEKLKNEKDDLIRLLKDESNKSKEKCNKLEREIENLNKRYSSEEKMHQHNAYELMQLQNDIKICTHEKAQLEEALNDQKEDNIELEKKIRDLELNRSKFTQCDEYEKVMAKLKKEKQELQDKCKRKDELLQKADKENRNLKGGIDQLKSNIIGHKQEIETLNNRMEILREEKLEIENRTRSRSPKVTSETKQCQKCWKYKNDISELKKEVNSLRDRLSEAAGNKLRDNNPNIADLSDMNRPTSLAEKFSTLYTDEYTDAMEVIETDMSEEECAGTMLQWLKSCYDWCEQLAKEQRDLLTESSIGFMKKYLVHGENFVISARCLIHVKEFQKKIAVDSLIAVGKICHIKSFKEERLLSDNHITKYIKKCSELCWMMQISDPPLCLKFDVKRGESLDRNSYNVFTKSGSKVDFLVWPVIYLHKTGPLLAKGVAQGM